MRGTARRSAAALSAALAHPAYAREAHALRSVQPARHAPSWHGHVCTARVHDTCCATLALTRRIACARVRMRRGIRPRPLRGSLPASAATLGQRFGRSRQDALAPLMRVLTSTLPVCLGTSSSVAAVVWDSAFTAKAGSAGANVYVCTAIHWNPQTSCLRGRHSFSCGPVA